MVTADRVKELREQTGAGMMDCKKALSECGGDFAQAIDYLRKKGLSAAAKKAGRATLEGRIATYVHGAGKIAVMVEVNCETDFVAKTDQFQEMVKDIAMHIAAAAPVCVNAEDMPADFVEKERNIYLGQLKEDPKMVSKPEQVLNKIIEGKVQKLFDEQCLMKQKFVKDPNITVADFVSQSVAKLGENMNIRRFTRYVLGEK